MPPSDGQLSRIAAHHQAQLEQTRRRAVASVGRAWDVLQPVDDAALDRWLRAAVPIVDVAKTRAAGLTVAYVRGYVGQATGAVPTVDVSAAAVAADVRGGVTTAEVLTRPVVAVRTALSLGHSPLDALKIGRARAVQYADTDPQLAFREAFRRAAEQIETIVGYRRIPDAGACKFCLVASTQRYHVRDLMPLHNACGCTSAPIIGDRDPGHVIDPERLASLKGEVAVRHHGELGPVLVDPDDHFAGPSSAD
jgi:hypothetical protein